MKKIFKFEQWFPPKAAAADSTGQESAKPPKIRNMLLQTYFTSLICLVLCVGMFLGTSYAWFTSEVVNESNEIYVGTLKVGFYKEEVNDQGAKTSLDLTDNAAGHKLFSNLIRWEPGYTALETIRIANDGELAFKYEMTFRDGAVHTNSGLSLEKIAANFEVWVFDHENGYKKPESFSDIQKQGSKWTFAGNLDTVLKSGNILAGELDADQQIDNSTVAAATKPAHTYTIALHMKEDAKAEAMGSIIKLNVKLVAYQTTSEKDDTGSNTYDAGIVGVADVASLNAALGKENVVILGNDLTLSSDAECIVMNGGKLDGNGKTITYNGTMVNGNSVGVLTTTGGEISNLTIAKGYGNGRALYVTELKSDLTVSNCVFNGAYGFNITSSTKTDATVKFFNTTFMAWTSYDNVAKEVIFTDCKFEANFRPYGDTTLINCTINPSCLDLSHLEEGEQVILKNTTYLSTSGAVTIDEAVLTKEMVDGEMTIVVKKDTESKLKITRGSYVVGVN